MSKPKYKYYGFKQDGASSYIEVVRTDEELKSGDFYCGYEVFITYTEAKEKLIDHLKLGKDIYLQALREARDLRKADIED